ncbi:MAG: alpha/beta fold hydrolase [Bacteroidetes bacterium]|nr:alpha/beta fold hydrolase [Bacteroidota bacterium]
MIANGTLLDSTPVAIPATSLAMSRRSMSAADFAAFSAVGLHEITYMSNGLRIKAWLALPPAGPATFPAIIFNRGGSGPRGALTAEGAMQYAGLYASWGYVCIASNYRGVGGSEGGEEWGAGDVDDAMHVLPLLESLGYVDADRIGLIGGSRGGMMALMMLRRTQRFRAAATICAPTMIHATDSAAYIRKTMVKHLAADADVQREAEVRSAVLWAHELSKSTPLLVMHGTGDKRVSPDHGLHLGLALQAAHHPYRLIMYENADHVLAGRRRESNTDLRWWMDHFVRDRGPLPRVGPHGA